MWLHIFYLFTSLHCHIRSVKRHSFSLQVADAIRRHINFEVTKCVLLASPGFVKEEFFDYLLAYARRESESNDGKSAKAILDNKGKFIIAHSASGHKSALTGEMVGFAKISFFVFLRTHVQIWCLMDFFVCSITCYFICKLWIRA